MTTFEYPRMEPAGTEPDHQASSADDQKPDAGRRWTPKRTAIVAAVAVGVAGIGGVAAANAGRLIPSEQSGPGGGGAGRTGGFGGGARPGGTGTGTGMGPGQQGTTGGTGTTTGTTTGKTTSLVTPAGVGVLTVTGRSRAANAVEVLATTGSRPSPQRVVVAVDQPLSTAAELTGSRHDVVEDDDAEI